ncbi:MAG: hypothetical protein BHV65_09245 [Alistipes sp. 58_9_plus]|nr:MAG: hypothetical protein BHV65_09245 [Alistipes sp. 58_9_plus]
MEIQKITELWSRVEVLVFIIGWSMFLMIQRKIQGTFVSDILESGCRRGFHTNKNPRNRKITGITKCPGQE